MLFRSPAPWVRNFRAQTESPTQAFTDAEVAHILDLPNRATSSGLMHSVMLHLLFYLGLRRGELVALRARHIGWDRMGGENGDRSVMTIRVPGKGDKERVLPLPAKTQLVLERYLDRKGLRVGEGDEFLFSPVRNNITKTKNRPIDGQSVYYVVTKYARLAGVEIGRAHV